MGHSEWQPHGDSPMSSKGAKATSFPETLMESQHPQPSGPVLMESCKWALHHYACWWARTHTSPLEMRVKIKAPQLSNLHQRHPAPLCSPDSNGTTRLKIWLRWRISMQTVLLSPAAGRGQRGSSTTTGLTDVMLSRPQGSVIQNTLHAMEPLVPNSRTRTVFLLRSFRDIWRL